MYLVVTPDLLLRCQCSAKCSFVCSGYQLLIKHQRKKVKVGEMETDFNKIVKDRKLNTDPISL